MGMCAFHDDELTPAEYKAIEVHKYYLSEKAGYDVGMEFAIADWLKNHAVEWRKRRFQKDNRDQIREIKKHKWIESEKAGRDLGDQAALDWVVKYAKGWRRRREQCRAFDLNS
jgi:hypothetical protein